MIIQSHSSEDSMHLAAPCCIPSVLYDPMLLTAMKRLNVELSELF